MNPTSKLRPIFILSETATIALIAGLMLKLPWLAVAGVILFAAAFAMLWRTSKRRPS